MSTCILLFQINVKMGSYSLFEDWSVIQRVIAFSLFRSWEIVVEQKLFRNARRMTSRIVALIIAIHFWLTWKRARHLMIYNYTASSLLRRHILNLNLRGWHESVGTRLSRGTFSGRRRDFAIRLLVSLRSPDLEDALLSALWLAQKRIFGGIYFLE